MDQLPPLAAPAQRALIGVGITNLQKLAEFSEQEILALHGMGPNALKTIKQAMDRHTLSFKQ